MVSLDLCQPLSLYVLDLSRYYCTIDKFRCWVVSKCNEQVDFPILDLYVPNLIFYIFFTKICQLLASGVRSSATRFGEILPLWQNFTNLRQIFEVLISMWQTFEHTLEKSVCFWANLHCCK